MNGFALKDSMKSRALCVVALLLTSCADESAPPTPLPMTMNGGVGMGGMMAEPMGGAGGSVPPATPSGTGGSPAPINSDCHQPMPRCATSSSSDQVIPAASQKDRDSKRGFRGHYCAKVENNVTTKVSFVVEQACAYNEKCEEAGDKTSCVSCGRQGSQYLRLFKNSKLETDCEGCGCHITGGTCHVGSQSPTGQPAVQVGLYGHHWIGSTGVALAATDSKAVAKVHRMDIRPGGEFDIELIVEKVQTDSYGAQHVLKGEARIVGNCP